MFASLLLDLGVVFFLHLSISLTRAELLISLELQRAYPDTTEGACPGIDATNECQPNCCTIPLPVGTCVNYCCIQFQRSMSFTGTAQDDIYWGKETFACFLCPMLIGHEAPDCVCSTRREEASP